MDLARVATTTAILMRGEYGISITDSSKLKILCRTQAILINSCKKLRIDKTSKS